jgi:flagellar hook-associated protein 3 FlgL
MPVISRISTLSVHQRLVNDFGHAQTELIRLQRQISSGLKTDTFQGLTGDVEQFSGVEAEIEKLRTFENTNTENISRLRSARNVMESAIGVVDGIENLMTLRRNGALEDTMQFEQQIRDMRFSFVRELNTSHGGRYLFGGTRTDAPPVIDDPIPAPVEPGVPDDSYYQGSKENLTLRPGNHYEMEFDIRADDPGFQKVMAAVDLSILADEEDDEAMVAQSLDLLQEGLREMIALQAHVDAKTVALEEINDRHEALRLHFTTVQKELITTDILTASTELAVNETILQATFQSFARINALRLTDFLG